MHELITGILSFVLGIVIMSILFWVHYKIRYIRKKRRLEKQHRDRMEEQRIQDELFDIWAREYGTRNNIRRYLEDTSSVTYIEDCFGNIFPQTKKDPIKPKKKKMYHHFTGLPWE
jgi:hypothetical protein